MPLVAGGVFGLCLGSGPVLLLFFWLFVLFECVGRYAYLTGGCALLPYAFLRLFVFCHLHFVQFHRDSNVSLCLVFIYLDLF
jgi:hypothetical protein